MKRKYLLMLLFLIFGFVLSIQARATCWSEAASKYDVDPLLLMAIGWQESRGNPNAIGPPLKDGNVAIGLMQINTIHLPNLRKQGISRNDLFNPCVSVQVGASVLRDCINRFGEIWRSVGCYYGGPASKAYTAMSRYAESVKGHYGRYVQMYRGDSNFAYQQTQSIQQQATQLTQTGVTMYEPQIIYAKQADSNDINFIMFDR